MSRSAQYRNFSLTGLVRRSLIHYWAINLAVALAVAVGGAVLIGSLLVGDSVRGSLRRLALERLGRIDLLQIHKSTPAVLRDPGVHAALEYARRCGVTEFGASVTDLETARTAVADGFTWLQLFYNRSNAQLAPVFSLAAGRRLIVNRPFAMGALADAPVEAFAFVLRARFSGVVLTGAGSLHHLRRNVEAFRTALAEVRSGA